MYQSLSFSVWWIVTVLDKLLLSAFHDGIFLLFTNQSLCGKLCLKFRTDLSLKTPTTTLLPLAQSFLPSSCTHIEHFCSVKYYWCVCQTYSVLASACNWHSMWIFMIVIRCNCVQVQKCFSDVSLKNVSEMSWNFWQQCYFCIAGG